MCATAMSILTVAARATLSSSDQASSVTFTKDVAPIVFEVCVTCHRPAGSAPFSLLTYVDVGSRAERIVEVTRRRIMPPWKPEQGYGEFTGERRLSAAQIATLQKWLDGGALEGDPASLPPVPAFSSEWQLGEPDLVLEAAPYVVPAGSRDIYRNFVLPIPTRALRYVRAWQFLPGNSHVVHHATMEFDATGTSRRLDAADPEPGYEGVIPHTVQRLEGFFLGWTPGHMTYAAPEGMAWPLRPGADLVMMLHLRPHRQQEPIQAKLGLYFSDAPPSRLPTIVRLTRQNLDIPAGDARHVVTDSFRLDVDVDAYSVQPHAHYLAREVRAFATLPGGRQEPLISIREWDFDWQGVYNYRRPVSLPAGTIVTMEYVYDNSTRNPRNPNNPPQRVTFGQQTSDEMAELWIQVVARNAADRLRLTRAVEAKVMREEIVGLEKRLERDPANVALHNDVALLHVAARDLDRAAAHFAEALRLDATSPAAHYNLGNVLLGQRKPEAAADYFAKALALKPDYALAHDGLGLARRAEGKLDDAVQHHREAIRLAPLDADAHYHLASTLRAQGRLDEARVAYRQALQIAPAHTAARAELASLEQQLGR